MSSQNEPTGSAPQGDKPQYTKAFFATGEKGGPVVSLVIDPKNPKLEPGRPAFFGTVGETNVSVFVKAGGTKGDRTYGPFLSISVRGQKAADGTYGKDTPFGTGNIRVMKDGQIRLVIDQPGKDAVWCTPRKELTQDQLVAVGLDLARLESARATAAAAKAAGGEGATPRP